MEDLMEEYCRAISLIIGEYKKLRELNKEHSLLGLVVLFDEDRGFVSKEEYRLKYDSDERNVRKDKIGQMHLYYHDLIEVVGQISGETGLARIVGEEHSNKKLELQ